MRQQLEMVLQKVNDQHKAQDAPDDVLYFVPKLRPAVADGADEISYHGVIIDGALVCWVSFPGMYKAGWDGLVDGRHGDSVACVFLCEPKDGRNFRDFGYLHNIKKRRRACSEDELQRILQKAEAMHSDAIVFADDTPEQIALMEKKAEELWKEHGEIGTVSMGELPKADLWDGIGCGGSQKCEIARGYKYEEVDVGEFLTGQFKRGDEAEALDGSTWRRCEVLDVPKKMISKEDVATWQVECKLSGRVFDSKHVRSSRDSLKSLLAAFHSSHDSLEKLFGEVGITIEKAQESGPRNGAPALSVKVEIKNIKQAHLLRDRVLEGELDIQLNKILSEKAPSSHTWDIGIEKNHFIELYERTLPGLLELTPHQYQKLQELESGNSQNLHLAAPAGAGKTFVALRYVVRHLRSSRSGRLLYVAPNRALLFHFVQWLMASLKAKSIDPRRTRIWERLLLKHQGQKAFWRPVLDGRHLKLQETPLGEDEFSLVVVDEAHQLFASGDEMDLLTLPRKKLLLLSDTSQSTHLHHHFPTAHYVELSEVIRSTQRIVAGAMPFQHAQSASSVQGMGTEGPPLKSFLFEVESEKTMMQDYVKHTVDTMWHVLQTFPGVSLSRRLALLVKDETFLQDFKPLMVQKIQEELPARRFAFVSCEECCSYLPSHLVPHSSSRDEEEIIVLDAVQNSRGLEQLIVVSIALDTSIDGNADNETRSYLYTGITRAQLQAVVVNHFIPDGWLAFLGTLKLKNEKFTQRAALAAIRKDAATSAVADAPRPATEKQDKEAAKQHTEVPDPGALRHKAGTQQGDEMSADKKADQDLKDMQSRADAVKVAAKVFLPVAPIDFRASLDGCTLLHPGLAEIRELSANLMILMKAGNDHNQSSCVFLASLRDGELSELPELRVKGTSVWDTASNAINTKIVQLKFDPRISRLSEEVVATAVRG
ncbi:Helicase ATP-binding domain-containing protein [Durusdinium trenchii]|uniref:Helicase ATP-binding domain-containing protein n=1 Tax=Durusdinium trenchii TaxID=1381693 RepID=A0ABP0SNC9_9DINO